MKPRTATPGRRAQSRGRSAPPERTRTQHGTQHHHAQSQKSVGSRQSRGRSASRRRKQHPWLRKLLGAVQFPLRALHTARTRRKTVRVHLQGGTDATARRVVEAVVESLMLNFAEFQPASQAHPAATEGDSMQCSDTIHKQRIAQNKIEKKKRAKGRRQLLQCMYRARLRVERMDAEARSLAAEATTAARGKDRLEADRLQQAIELYLQRASVATSGQTVVEL